MGIATPCQISAQSVRVPTEKLQYHIGMACISKVIVLYVLPLLKLIQWACDSEERVILDLIRRLGEEECDAVFSHIVGRCCRLYWVVICSFQ